jgi:hypothetical protein
MKYKEAYAFAKVLTEELNPDNLAERIMKAKVALKKEIELLKVSDRKPSENGNKMLFDLVGDLYDLVVLARKNNNNLIAIKTDRIWKEQIYPLLKEYDLQVFIYNKKHDKKLPFIKDRIGLEVKASVR